jgi:DNA polymerase III subunit delta
MAPAAGGSRRAARSERGGVFFVYGDEEFLKEDAIARIVAAHLDPATRDFNYDQLRASDADPETLLSITQTPPMMAEWRVVIVREVQALAANARGRAVLDTLLATRVPGLALVLSAQIPDRSTARVWERLKKETRSREYARLAPADLPGWLIARAEAGGVALEEDAATALASASDELGVITQELAKLSDYVADRRSISRDDVLAVVGSVPRVNRWEWFDLVGARRFADARHALPHMLDAGESGVGILIGLASQILRIGIAVAGGERALQQHLPAHQRWLAQRIARQTRGWGTAAIDAALDDMLRADRLLKSASLSDLQIVEELLLRMEQRERQHAAAGA